MTKIAVRVRRGQGSVGKRTRSPSKLAAKLQMRRLARISAVLQRAEESGLRAEKRRISASHLNDEIRFEMADHAIECAGVSAAEVFIVKVVLVGIACWIMGDLVILIAEFGELFFQ